MSVEDLVLKFIYDDDTGKRQYYLPGDVIRGTVTLHLRRPIRVRTMNLMILGGAAVSWEEVGNKKLYTAREEYLQGVKVLLDSGAEGEDSLEMRRGQHLFSFQYQLPSHLPSTFDGIYGSVTYVAKVLLTPEDDHATTMTSEPFMVLRRPPLPSQTFADVEMKASKLFFGFMKSGQIRIKCRINRSAAIPGEIIYVTAEVSNWSPKGITLLQGAVLIESTFHAQNSKNKKISFSQVLNKRIDVFDVYHVRGRRWRNVQIAIPPFLPDSGLKNCSVMDVDYVFEFRAQVEGRNDVVVRCPLYVGGHPEEQEEEEEERQRRGSSQYSGRMNTRYHRMQALTFQHNNELPWYGGGGETVTEMESVDGDMFAIR